MRVDLLKGDKTANRPQPDLSGAHLQFLIGKSLGKTANSENGGRIKLPKKKKTMTYEAFR